MIVFAPLSVQAVPVVFVNGASLYDDTGARVGRLGPLNYQIPVAGTKTIAGDKYHRISTTRVHGCYRNITWNHPQQIDLTLYVKDADVEPTLAIPVSLVKGKTTLIYAAGVHPKKLPAGSPRVAKPFGEMTGKLVDKLFPPTTGYSHHGVLKKSIRTPFGRFSAGQTVRWIEKNKTQTVLEITGTCWRLITEVHKRKLARTTRTAKRLYSAESGGVPGGIRSGKTAISKRVVLRANTKLYWPNGNLAGTVTSPFSAVTNSSKPCFRISPNISLKLCTNK